MQLNDRWVTLLYESCSEAVVNLAPKRQILLQVLKVSLLLYSIVLKLAPGVLTNVSLVL